MQAGALPCPAQPRSPSPGLFNPNSEDPLPGQLKKQLVLRIISGQQLPKPRDSMLGDRGEVGRPPGKGVGAKEAVRPPGPGATLPSAQIIDPFVEVEVIGLPVDCRKEQTRVVDDNGEGMSAAPLCQPARPRAASQLPRWQCQSYREPKGRGPWPPGLPGDPSNHPGHPLGWKPSGSHPAPRHCSPWLGSQPRRRCQERVWAQVASRLELGRR